MPSSKVTLRPKMRRGTVKILPSDEKSRYIPRNGSLSINVEFFNYTDQNVRTLDHTGMTILHVPITPPAEETEFRRHFVIRKRIEVSNSSRTGMMTESVDYTDEVPNDVLEDIVTQLSGALRQGSNKRNNTTRYGVFIDDLKKEGTAYVKDADILVYLENYTGVIVHPNSERALIEYDNYRYAGSHAYVIHINDPDGKNTPYYINLNSRVFKIIPTSNYDMEEEVRIEFKNETDGTEIIYSGPLDDIKLREIGLFRNYSDADNYAEKDALATAQAELELVRAKSEHERLKLASASETLDVKLNAEKQAVEQKLAEMQRKTELAEIQHVKDLEKLRIEREEAKRDLILEREKSEMQFQQLRIKDHYENRSYDRKDSSEALKFLPMICGGLLAAFAVLKK